MWTLAAVVGAAAGLRQGEAIEDLIIRAHHSRSVLREESAARLLHLLLTPEGELGRYEWRLFVPDPDDRDNLVVPPFAPVKSNTVWPVGQGVTGVAYETGEPQYAFGQEIETSFPVEPGVLDPDREARHAQLKVVAAMPLTSARGRVIGVLTASSNADLDHIATVEAAREHSRMADAAARVLIDMLDHRE
jgi:hypothetical protein